MTTALPMPFTDVAVSRLQELLEGLVTRGATPGGVIVCGTADGVRKVLEAGTVDGTGPEAPSLNTVYDMASLTKVLVTWPLVGVAVADGVMDLDSPVRAYLPAMAGDAPGGEATVRQLLSHTSGLMASTRLDRYRDARAPLHELLCREELECAPGPHRYLNRGFILLGLAVEHVRGQGLDALTDVVFGGDLPRFGFGPVGRSSSVAPTERRLPGAAPLRGSVHDENAALMGGVAGHAGLFAAPGDLMLYAERLLTAYRSSGEGGWPWERLGPWLRQSMAPQVEIGEGLHRGLAWIVTGEGVVYHHGWTGTSLYLAPEMGRYVAVCTNAVACGPAGPALAGLREVIWEGIRAT